MEVDAGSIRDHGHTCLDLSGLGCTIEAMFDPNNRCDLCDKALLVTSPVRTRCDQCAQYGPPQLIAPRLREFGVKADATGLPCTGCGRDLCHDGATVLQLVEGYCLSCRLDGLHQTG